ncbi:MAG: 6-bladed beta-propeller [Acidobacteria bacterium]|nr:6-bladed beta-propeller [Acidobacteriota bacterium]
MMTTTQNRRRLLSSVLVFAAILSWIGCSDPKTEDAAQYNRVAPSGQEEVPAVRIRESYTTEKYAGDDLDSVAVWHGDGNANRLIVTSKAKDRLLVFDASTGAFVRHVGNPGNKPGEFSRPNGIAVSGNFLFVVERDNQRLQALRLPDFQPLGTTAAGELQRPYGIALVPGMQAYVTDNYDAPESAAGQTEGLAATLDRRIKRFSFTPEGPNSLASKMMSRFGNTDGPGILWKVETIAADPEKNRLLVADERNNKFNAYTLEGRFRGEVMGEGIFRYEPEGAALVRCGGKGYWIACDQEASLSCFRVFDRDSLNYIGTFTGCSTANTDGVALTQAAFPSFPGGAFFAIDDDAAVSAFDLEKIFDGLGLRCGN